MRKECLTIIGTAHVSDESVNEVRDAIIEEEPDIVAIELCYNRFSKMKNEKDGVEEKNDISIGDIIRSENLGIFLVSTVLGYFQNKVGEDVGVKPGSEMIAAIETAEETGAQIALIDRDINITLKRVMNQMSFKEKFKFVVSLIGSLITSDEDLEKIEDLKNEDTINEVMNYFKEVSPKAYNALVHERDAYLSLKLLQLPDDAKIIAVVGAGHKPGITEYIENPETLPSIQSLESIEKEGRNIPWTKIILFLIPLSFVVIFFLAFMKGININEDIIDFVLLTGTLGFLGSILSGSKIQSAIVAFLVAPLTVIHPLLAAGWFSGLVEAKYRHLSTRDFDNLSKIGSFKELWRNNLFRILIVVMGTNIGVSLGTFISIPNIFWPLLSKLLGMG